MGWVSAVDSRGPNSLKEHRKVEKLEATVACLAATLKEQAVQTQKRSAQLEASKPAPRVANNPRAASAPTKQNQFTISRPNPFTGQVVMFGGLADVNPITPGRMMARHGLCNLRLYNLS